jgi:hypothetical protein
VHGICGRTDSKRDQLVSVIKVNPEFHKLGIGFNAFKLVFDHLSVNTQIKYIVGAWCKDDEFVYLPEGKSTNLLVFQSNLANGMSLEDAAINTPTGKWASKLGYGLAKVSNYDLESVEVLFFKQHR